MPTACTRSRPCSSGSISATVSSSGRPTGSRSRASPTTRSSPRASRRLAAEAGVEPAWRVRISKEIPVAAGLGGGSADAAAALRLANGLLPEPLSSDRLHGLAASLGADVPFFLEPGPKLAEGAGERLTPLDLPQDVWVAVALPQDVEKQSTGAVYGRYDELGGGPGFEERRAELARALEEVRRPSDLARLPANDLAEASGAAGTAAELRAAGAFRADVSGAGPAVYGLFSSRSEARAAASSLGRRTRDLGGRGGLVTSPA